MVCQVGFAKFCDMVHIKYFAQHLSSGLSGRLRKTLRRGKYCGVAQLVARRLAVRQARVRFSARHHREVFPTEQTSDEEMERGLSEWRWINVYCMNVIE